MWDGKYHKFDKSVLNEFSKKIIELTRTMNAVIGL